MPPTSSTGANQHSRQSFQACTSPNSSPVSEPVDINTRWDNKAGQHVVLWSEIRLVFKDADYIANDGTVVPFMTDDDFNELKPPRIHCQPGVILRVVVSGRDSPLFTAQDSESITILAAQPAMPHPGLIVVDDFTKETAPVDSLPLRAPGLSIPQSQLTDTGLTVRSQFMEPGTRVRRHSFNGPPDQYFQAIMTNQMQLTNIVDDGFDRLLVEMDSKNRDLQQQLVQMQERYQELQERSQMAILEMQEKTRRDILEKQEEVLIMQQQMSQMQHQALDRLALIQNRVQTVITQTYELHEYPIPRLFIILPKEKKKRDKFQRPFVKQFRLYFLCECGAHTKVEGSKMSHEIHLAKHEGYDIDKPDEFFEKYGSYVLTMLQMVKYGFVAAGIAVPALAHLKLIESIDIIQNDLDFTKKTIGALVDESITFIKDQTSGFNHGIKITADQTELDKQEVLEGADLRQLESYLSVNDKGRILGNLYRIVTLEGHVKWVCMDHYRDLYHQAAVMELKEIILANDGSFVEEEGKFEVKLRSSILATQIYDSIVKARCVQELTVFLGWEVTRGDLQCFASAVTKANVVNLRLRGCGLGEPTNVDSSLFQPIIQLMSNGRIQSMDIATMNAHFPCVDASTMKSALKLRSLSISPTQQQTGDSWPTLVKILDNCPSLTELMVSSQHSRKICVYIQRNAPILRALKTVIVREEGMSAAMVLSQGTVEHFKASLQTPTFGESEDDKDFLFGGYLSKLELTKIEEMDRDRLTAIIHRNPRLVKLGIIFRSKKWLDIVEWIQSAANDLTSRGQRISLRNVVACIVSEASRVTHVMKFQGRSPMSKFSTKIKLFSTIANDDSIFRLFRQYGRSFTALEALYLPDNGLGRLVPLLSNSTEKAGSKLESLILELRGLPLDCLECIDRVIARSADLKDLRFTLSLDDERRQEKAEWLSSRHGNSLTGLTVCSNGVAPWTAEIAQWLPRRRDFPKLKKIEIRGLDITQHSQSFALWICDIVSAPPPSKPSASPVPTQLASPNTSTISVSSPDTSTHLRTIKIEDAVLSEEQWQTVFVAIDFTALNELDFNGPQFPLGRFRALINNIPNSSEYGGMLPLKKLSFSFESLEPYQRDELETLVATLAEKAPLANVFGLPVFKK